MWCFHVLLTETLKMSWLVLVWYLYYCKFVMFEVTTDFCQHCPVNKPKNCILVLLHLEAIYWYWTRSAWVGVPHWQFETLILYFYWHKKIMSLLIIFVINSQPWVLERKFICRRLSSVANNFSRETLIFHGRLLF